MTLRIERLRERFLEADRHVDLERALIVTDVYKTHEYQPPIVRRALALHALCAQMTIVIRPDELIVGAHTPNLRGVPLFPEYATDWILRDMDSLPTRKGDQFLITQEQKQILGEKLRYWKGRCLRDQIISALPTDLKESLRHGLYANENYTMSGPGHMVPDYGSVLRLGLANRHSKCQSLSSEVDSDDSHHDAKYDLYKACGIVCEALRLLADRYAEKAEYLAQREQDAQRAGELQRIAENCRRVPWMPAKSLWEALQGVFFVQMALQLESNGLAIALGVLDQTLYPFYQQDHAAGSLDDDHALELLECFYLKLGELDKIYSNEATRYLQGPGHGQTISLGGVTPEGVEASNRMSELLLMADRGVRLVQPDLAIKVRQDTPKALLREACINIRMGLTKPKLLNDDTVMRAMTRTGVTLRDARNWAALGCSEAVVCGATNSWGNAGQLNLAKCLELALNDGKCILSDVQMGPHTGAVTDLCSFEKVMAAFEAQVQHHVGNLVRLDNIIDRYQAEQAPLALYSLVTQDCLETGTEFNAGGARYNTTSPLGVGPITAGDSLAAIQAIVFKQRLISLADLVQALRDNFAGSEKVRQMLINRAPKFGNDNACADGLCNDVLEVFCDQVGQYTNPRHGPFVGGLYYLTANIAFGMRTAATPDGRRRGEPLNDGGISPVHGRDTRGLTAVARSVGRLDMLRVPHGAVLNQRLHHSLLEGDEGLEMLDSYLRAFMRLGGWETQVNVVTSETLRDAQNNPEHYKDLVIRVAGYSAYFVDLERELQDDILARTEKLAY